MVPATTGESGKQLRVGRANGEASKQADQEFDISWRRFAVSDFLFLRDSDFRCSCRSCNPVHVPTSSGITDTTRREASGLTGEVEPSLRPVHHQRCVPFIARRNALLLSGRFYTFQFSDWKTDTVVRTYQVPGSVECRVGGAFGSLLIVYSYHTAALVASYYTYLVSWHLVYTWYVAAGNAVPGTPLPVRSLPMAA